MRWAASSRSSTRSISPRARSRGCMCRSACRADSTAISIPPMAISTPRPWRTDAMSMIADMVARGAAATPHKTALIQDDEALDYATLHDLTCRCVAALKASGIRKGDRVAFLGLNHIDYVILLIAALRIGAVTVAVNWRLVPREIAYIIQDAGARFLLTQSAVLGNALAVRAEAGLETILLSDGAFEGRPAFRQLVQGFAPDDSVAALEPADVAVQLYTS